MRCPRCTGCLHGELEAVRCLNCGAHYYPPFVEPPLLDPRPLRAGMCAMCGEEALKHRTYCRACSRLESEISRTYHGKRIKAGMANARGRG
jgi:NAD-dependent SIR2 family protein deacetylase